MIFFVNLLNSTQNLKISTCGICTIHLPGLEPPEVRALASFQHQGWMGFFWFQQETQQKPRHHKFFCNTMIEILPKRGLLKNDIQGSSMFIISFVYINFFGCFFSDQAKFEFQHFMDASKNSGTPKWMVYKGKPD